MAYEQLEKGYRVFLSLLRERKVIPAQLSREENQTIDALRTKGSASWRPFEAVTLLKVLRRHVGELRTAGFNVDSIPPLSIRPAPGAPSPAGAKPSIRPAPRSVSYNGEVFEVRYEYNPALNAEIREIPGKSYNVEKRVWLIPLSQAEALRTFAARHGFSIAENAGRLLSTVAENVEASYAAAEVPLDIPLKLSLLPFQTAGVAYGLKNKRIILADQMGLGKTVQAIAAVVGANLFPCLVICPKSLRLNWKAEWAAWTNRKAHIFTEQLRDHLHFYVKEGYADVCITHYEGMKKYLIADYYKPKGGTALVTLHRAAGMFKSIIIDEAHELRNRNTERFQLARGIVDGKAMRLLLTGTPVVNTVSDLTALLELSGQIDQFGGVARFTASYGALTRRVFETDSKAARPASNRLRELNIRLRATCFIRREKHQVLKELPDKLRQIIPVELDNRPEYEAAMHNLTDYLDSFGTEPIPMHGGVQSNLLAHIGRLKRIAARGKLYAVFDLVDTVHAAGEKVIIFCWHLETVAALRARYPAAVSITGEDSDEAVDANKKAFQNDPNVKTIIVTFKRGGVGHTLTAASKVLFVEYGWNHKDMDQAEDRAHRIGAKDTVNCYYFSGRQTIDNYLYEIIDSKRRAAGLATGGTEDISTEIGVVAQLVRRLRSSAKTPGVDTPGTEVPGLLK